MLVPSAEDSENRRVLHLKFKGECHLRVHWWLVRQDVAPATRGFWEKSCSIMSWVVSFFGVWAIKMILSKGIYRSFVAEREGLRLDPWQRWILWKIICLSHIFIIENICVDVDWRSVALCNEIGVHLIFFFAFGSHDKGVWRVGLDFPCWHKRWGVVQVSESQPRLSFLSYLNVTLVYIILFLW